MKKALTIAAVTLALALGSTAAEAGGRYGGHHGRHWGGHHSYYGGHHHWRGPGPLGIALGVTGALVGAAVVADHIAHPYYYGPRYYPAPVYYGPAPVYGYYGPRYRYYGY